LVVLAALTASQTVFARVPFKDAARFLPVPGEQSWGDNCGQAVALDGDTLVVGAPLYDFGWQNAGAVFVYNREDDGSWEITATLTGENKGSRFGSAVAIDGDRIVVGAPWDDEVDLGAGAAFIFIRLEDEWHLEAKLLARSRHARFGSSVDIDNEILMVGAPDEHVNGIRSGVATVFEYSGGSWNEVADLDVPAGASEFGHSVSIEGNRAVVGAPSSGPSSHGGIAAIYVRHHGIWRLENEFQADSPQGFDYFGSSVAIQGQWVVVGAKGDEENGATYVFRLETDATWSRFQRLVPSGDPLSGFGAAAALDQKTLIVGAPREPTAFAYTFNGDAWVLQDELDNSDLYADGDFGFAVAVDGGRAVVGAPSDAGPGEDRGATFLFERRGERWPVQVRLYGAGTANGHFFGGSVAVEDGLAVVGAPHDPDGAVGAGAAYIFARGTHGWELDQKIPAVDPTEYLSFGHAVAVVGDTVLIGTPYRNFDQHTSAAGAVYLYRKTGGLWHLEETWLPNSPREGGGFGFSIDTDGSKVAVGAPGNAYEAADESSVEIYEPAGDGWVFSEKITHFDIGIEGKFGQAVAIFENTLLTGSRDFDEAYILERTVNGWELAEVLSPDHGRIFPTEFGTSLALDKNQAMVGNPGEDIGTVYVYGRGDSGWFLEGKLVPGERYSYARDFGWSLDLRGNTAVIGSPSTRFDIVPKGTVHVWEKSSNGWSERGILRSDQGYDGLSFGWAVAFDGSYLLVGDPASLGDNWYSGEAYLYRSYEKTRPGGRRLSPD
jgi:hypothetical protein